MAKSLQRSQKSPIVELNDKNASRCLCPGCPTYMSSPCPDERREKIFCSTGMTDCDVDQRGCLCGDCQVFKEYGLKIGYFCVKGEATNEGNPAQPMRGK